MDPAIRALDDEEIIEALEVVDKVRDSQEEAPELTDREVRDGLVLCLNGTTLTDCSCRCCCGW